MTQLPPAALDSARTYQRSMVPVMFMTWVAALLDAAGVTAGSRVLDVACGPGTVARQAAERVGPGGAVSALDLNPAMLEVARTEPAPDAPQIAWQHGSAQALPYPDAAFSAVTCQQGLQFFPDRPGALREMRRVLEPGGRVAALVNRAHGENPLFGLLNAAGLKHVGVPLFAAPFSLGDREELERLLTEAGFEDVEVTAHTRTVRFPQPETFVPMILQGAAAAVPELAALSVSQREALHARITDDLSGWVAEHTENGELVETMGAHLAVGRR
ncbi:class I SAM-dependent methyltransferase [Deinococcus irradiatisoli]|nr:class I SAM-dependent methyltransferase [Deinococcus irradiatisoli]